MSKILVLAEKPSVARDIARVLGATESRQGYLEGKQYVVTWALGHLVTLADPEVYDQKYKTWQLADLPMLPEQLKLTVIRQTTKQYKAVVAQLKRSDVSQVVIATDAGREGELVARWIIQLSGVRKPMKRLWISSVTDKAIREGFRQLRPSQQYDTLFDAAVARSQADWYVGLNITRALTTKYNAQLNSGRVQTPVVAMIAQREHAIQQFVPKTYYGAKAILSGGIVATWQSKGQTSTFNRERIKQIVHGNLTQLVVTDMSSKRKEKFAPALYDLTELQREAYQKFGLSAKETLNTCQSLYETHKVLTYPRTDSRYLSSDMVSTLEERVKACVHLVDRTLIRHMQYKEVARNKGVFNDSKVSDHHAIIPTEQSVNFAKLSDKERKVYTLVVQRFLANLMPKHVTQEWQVTFDGQGDIFVAKASNVIEQGWTLVLGQESDTPSGGFQDIAVGTRYDIVRLEETTGQTAPPAYFNEATLLSAMENPTAFMQDDATLKETMRKTGGLGTVATRADIIDKLFNSFLIEKRGEAIVTTGKGKQLLSLVPEAVKSPELTGEWEIKLEQIAKGKLSKDQFIADIKRYTAQLVADIKASEEKFKHDNLTTKRCPECDKPMLAVNGKKGKLLVCQDRECGHRKNVSRLTNARCPQCKKKMELVGEGDGQRFVCKCGHREKLSAFQKRRQQTSSKADKRSVQQYLKQQKKEEPVNNALFDALKNFDV